MPFRRCMAPVSSRAFTARSIETSPQITSLTLLLEPPKSSPTVPLNDAPDLLLSAILTKMKTPEGMPRAGNGCNIPVRERRDHTHGRGKDTTRGVGDPQTATGVRRGRGLLMGQGPGARRLERALTDLHLPFGGPARLPGPLG